MLKKQLYIFLFLAILLGFSFSTAQNFGFKSYQFDTDDGLPSSEIYDLHEDFHGNIWLATDRGIVKYNGYEFRTYDTKDGLANLVNFSFQPMGDGTFWVNGFDGTLSYWNGTAFKPFAFNTELKSLRPDKKRWFDFIGVREDTLFLQLIVSNYWDITFPIYSVNVCDGSIKTHNEDALNLLYDSKQNDQIIKRRVNIARNIKTIKDSLKNNWRKIRLTHFQWDDQNKLKSLRNIGIDIIGLYIDEHNNEWVATRLGVLFFKNGDLSAKPTVLFKGIGVTSISKSKDGSLWVTSTDNGLFHVPNIHIKKYKPDGWIEGETIYKLKKVKGYLLALSEKGNIFSLDKNQLTNWNDNNTGESSFNNKELKKENSQFSIFQALPLKNKQFLVYTPTGFEIKTNLRISYSLKYKFKTLSTTIDSNENLWIATTEGLFKWATPYKKTEPKIIPVQGIEDFRVNDIKIDKEGTWLTSPKFGLVYRSDTLEHVFNHEKLEDKTLHSTFKLNDSILWVGSNRGLLKIKHRFENGLPIIDKVDLFTIRHGLISNYINDISFWNDEVWLATDKGLCHFKPNQLSVASIIPSLKIDFIETNLRKKIKSKYVTFQHNENDVTIYYTGISHNKPEKGFYRYKINDRPWTETNERKVSFLNLNHGEYTFKVQCRSDHSEWSDTEQLIFTIAPHFLEQSWFKALMMFSILLIIFLWILRYKKNWEKKLDNENRLRRSELTTLRNQMNPHFMFNSLTTIQGLIYKGEKLEANAYIGNFSRLMRKSLEYSKLENISLEEEVQFIENYLELEKKRFKTLFEYQIIVDPELSKNMLQVPPLLIQPLLENSIKHGFRGTDKNKLIEIIIQKHLTNTIFEVIIKDNGVGFDLTHVSNSNKSMGLGIVKDRIHLIRENCNIKEVSFQIESEIGKGTIIRLFLPLNS